MKNRVKHILSIILVIGLLLSSVPAVLNVAADNATAPGKSIPTAKSGIEGAIDLPLGDTTFEEGTPSSNWIKTGTANYEVVDTGHAGSSKSLYITTASNQAARIYYKFKVRKDTAYIVRFFAKGSLHSDNVLTAILTDHQISSGTVADNKIAGTDKVDTTLNTTTWQEISVALPVQDENSTDSMDCYLYLHVHNKSNVKVYFDDLTVAKVDATATTDVIDLPLSDTTFEEGTPSSNWIKTGTANYEVVDGGHAGSSKSLYITTTSNQAARIYYKFKARKDTAYAVRFFAKGSLHSDNVLTAALTDHQISSGTVADNKIAGTDKVDTTLNTTTWQEISVALPVQDENSTDSMDCYLYLHVNNKGNVKVYVDNLAIAKPIGVTVSAEGNGTATVTNQFGGASILYGDSAVFAAKPDAGYGLEGWYDSEDKKVSSDASYAVAVTDAIKLTAKFKVSNVVSLLNPDFEDPDGAINNAYGWEDVTLTTGEIATDKHQSGEKSAHFANDTMGDKYAFYKISGVGANKEYIVRFHAKVTIGSDGYLYRKVVTGKWSGTELAPEREVYKTTVWAEFTAIIPDSNTATTVYLGFRCRNCEFYIDDISVAKAFTVAASAEDGGTAEAKNQFGGTTLLYGDDIVFTATPDAGYAFDGWYDSEDKLVSNDEMYMSDSETAVDLTAKFVSTCMHEDVTEIPAVASTCTTPGHGAYKVCNTCGKTVEGSDEALPLDPDNHIPGEAVRENEKPASCTQASTYDEVVYCQGCGMELSRTPKTEGEPIAHTLGEWLADEVNHWQVCEECHDTIGLAAHTYDWVETVEATAEHNGLKEEICTVCGYKSGNSEEIIFVTHMPGDINMDGKVNNKDLTRLFQKLSGWDVEVDEKALDVNGDGKVNNKDLTRLFQKLSGWDVEIF